MSNLLALYRRWTARVVTLTLMIGILLASGTSPANAAYNYELAIISNNNYLARDDGTLTFWQNYTSRFTADVTLHDDECDSAGVVARFWTTTGAGTFDGYTAQLYYGGGCGNTGSFPGVIYNRPNPIRSVYPNTWLEDNGVKVSGSERNWPYVDSFRNPYT